jgi:CO/xanthine dehydrogenase Mo-binding subunit
MLAVQAEGRAVTTARGMDPSTAFGLRQAFAKRGAMGCGYCTPGMMLVAAGAAEQSEQGLRRAISGNICRCTGYETIVRAGLEAASAREVDGPAVDVAPGRSVSFVGELARPGALHLAILRSPLAHARVTAIDTNAARLAAGVMAVITADDLEGTGSLTIPTSLGERRPVLATDRVQFQGQEVAAVVAEDPYLAEDALELIEIEYEPLPAVVGADAALAEVASRLKEDNVWYRWEGGDAAVTAEAFEDAALVVSSKMIYPRIHGAPLETSACLAEVDGGRLVVHATVERPEETADALSGLLSEPVEVRVPDLGGGFGTKGPVYPGYVLAALAARQLGRPVRWDEPRSEHQATTTFGGDVSMRGELALSGNGRMLALRVDASCDHGAFLIDDHPPEVAWRSVAGPYDVPAIHMRVTGVQTNTSPGGTGSRTPVRTAESCLVIERLVDLAAARLGFDPTDLRRRNLLLPDRRGHRSPASLVHDASQHRRTLEVALSRIGYMDLRADQAGRRDGPLLGIGVSTFLGGFGDRPSSFGACVAAVEVDAETGRWQVRRMVTALDLGGDGSPVTIDGRIDGDLASGFGVAAFERIEYDEDGNCMSSTFMDYLVPGALETPRFETVSVRGFSGELKEGIGAVGSTAALANAVNDALSHLDAPLVDVPLTAAAVWEAIHKDVAS